MKILSGLLLFLFLLMCPVVMGQKPPIGTPIRFDDQQLAPMFPFKVEKGTPQNITNVQTWGSPFKQAGSAGFIQVKDADFFDQTGKKFFLGTNLSGEANFPDAQNAVVLAETLARFGINVVRLHHMDTYHIWGKNFKTKREFDPEKLDQLDRLIAELEKRGIYINMNLHVGLTFGPLDGVIHSDKYPSYCKGIDNVDPDMIAAQKRYAHALLTHVNPYTRRAYRDDPGIAMIEINNENSMILQWCNGSFDELPQPLDGYYKKLWNDWLQKKYGNSKKLRQAWKAGTEPYGPEMISEGSFQSEKPEQQFKKSWYLVQDNDTKASVTFTKSTGDASGVLTFDVRERGTASWVPQLTRSKLSCRKGQIYTFSCRARADKPATTTVQFGLSHSPWNAVGLNTKLELTPQWKNFEYSFIADSDESNARLMLASFENNNVYYFSNISLRTGGTSGIKDCELLEKGTVEPLRRYKVPDYSQTPAQRADWIAFMKEVEEHYWLDMYHYVKNGLKAKQPVSGTQLRYGFWYAQGKLDYCDIHAYWNHPRFPNKRWDREDWDIGAAALSSKINTSQATLPELAAVRVLDRPLTVSEYNHPYPNFYAAECMPMLSAFGAFQNWSGIYQYTWSHQPNYDPEQTKMTYFDACASQGTLVHLPACYAMFVRGDVNRGPGRFEYSAAMSEKDELKQMDSMLTGYHRTLKILDQRNLTLAVRSGIRLSDLPDSKIISDSRRISSWSELPKSFGSPEQKWIANEFNELRWNFEEDKACFQVDTTGTRVFSGFVRQREFNFDGLVIKPGKTRLDWTTVSLVNTSEKKPNPVKKDLLAPGRYLLAASGLIHNTNAEFVSLPGDRISTVHGGKEGTAPFLCEGVPLELTIKSIPPERIECYTLDAAGNRGQKIQAEHSANGSSLKLGPEYRTLWYELMIRDVKR